MEVDGMKEIFQRSVPQRNAKYIKYIGDVDTKTFPELQSTAPYSIEKVECVGHIQKRMDARLRKLKTMNRGKKLSDGKSISGKNRLTDKSLIQLPPIMAMLLDRIIAPLVICVRPYGQFIVIIGPLMRNLCITSAQLILSNSITGHRGNLRKFMRRKRVILPVQMIPQRKNKSKGNSRSNGISGAREEITVSSIKGRYKKIAHVQKC
ncbi:uncharacterized protein TNCV_1534451 [Trichonephila clavipes]|nr:uncharacterized protein TNCV_1534451 [Trichonephila clavipes]